VASAAVASRGRPNTVFADPSDTVAADCETVHGAATLAKSGHYAGKTSKGH